MGVFEKARVQMPGLTVLLVSLPLFLWYAIAGAVGGILCAKDLWFDERRASWINQASLPLVFLFYLAADFTLRAPMESLFRGMLRLP